MITCNRAVGFGGVNSRISLIRLGDNPALFLGAFISWKGSQIIIKSNLVKLLNSSANGDGETTIASKLDPRAASRDFMVVRSVKVVLRSLRGVIFLKEWYQPWR